MTRTLLVALFFVFLLSFAVPLSVEAATTCPDATYTLKGGICVPNDTGLSNATVSGILKTLMNWLLAILGLIAIIAFVISGLQYLTAAGDEKQAEKAKENMKYSIIGVIVALSGFIVIQAVAAALSATNTTF